MKNLLEEYGKAIFTIILMVILISCARPLGLNIKEWILDKIQTNAVLNNNDEKVLKGDAYAVLVENEDMITTDVWDTNENNYVEKTVHSQSLYFVRSEDPNFKNQTTYDNKKVINISTDIETTDYSQEAPAWLFGNDYKNGMIINVEVKDYIKPISTLGWFLNLYNCKSMDLSKLNTSNVIDMRSMFYNCNNLTTLDVSNFDTSNVTDMNGMFGNCQSLTTLDVTNFDTSKVTDMSLMFYNCKNLRFLNLENFDTSNIERVAFQMFYNCDNTKLLIFVKQKTSEKLYNDNSFATTNTRRWVITDLPNPVYAVLCTDGELQISGKYIDVVDGKTPTGKSVQKDYFLVQYGPTTNVMNYPSWNNSDDKENIKTVNFINKVKPTTCGSWFSGCSNLITLNNFTNLNTSECIYFGHMFHGCTNLTSVDISHFDTSVSISCASMFARTTNLKVINLGNISLKGDLGEMFGGSGISNIDFSHVDTSQATDMKFMFAYMGNITTLDISSFDTSKTTNMNWMFSYSNNLKTIKVGSKFTFKNVKQCEYFLDNCGTNTLTNLNPNETIPDKLNLPS